MSACLFALLLLHNVLCSNLTEKLMKNVCITLFYTAVKLKTKLYKERRNILYMVTLYKIHHIYFLSCQCIPLTNVICLLSLFLLFLNIPSIFCNSLCVHVLIDSRFVFIYEETRTQAELQNSFVVKYKLYQLMHT